MQIIPDEFMLRVDDEHYSSTSKIIGYFNTNE